MNNLNQYLNWLTITASGLCATLLLVTGAQAADSITTTPKSATATLTQFSPKLLIAAKKKQRQKQKVKRKVIKTQIKASTSPQTELTQTPPTPPEPAVPVPPAPAVTSPPAPTAPAEAPKTETPVPNQFSLNTKLEGQVIFGATGTFTGDFERNPAFG
ncbi:hypothetical protein, partial [Chamaesiphon sp.]|uniref:hypothetical protein n=1 Tax=Chamaesiphon sp. TaxID=2814140 RepID=UPI0035934B27